MVDQTQSITEELGMRTAKAASFLVSGRFIGLVIGAVMFIIVARLLAPHDYGVYVLIMSAVTIVSTVGNPNLGSYLKEQVPRLISKGQKAKVGIMMNDSLLISTLAGVVLVAVSVALGNQISVYIFHTSAYSLALDVGMLSVLFSLVFSVFNDALISINRSAAAAYINVVHTCVQLTTSVVLIYLGFGVTGALIGFSAGLVVSLLVEIYLVHVKYPLSLAVSGLYRRWSEAVNFAKHITLSSIISSVLLNLAVLYLGLFVSAATIGDYGIASKVGFAIDTFVGSISLALIPMFSEAAARRKEGIKMESLFHYSIYFSFLFALPMMILIALFSKELILLVLGTAYIGATIYMQLISIGLLLSIFGIFGVNFVVGHGKPQKVLKYAVISGVIEIVAIVALTYFLQAIGTILAVFYIGNIIPAILYLNYMRRNSAKLRGSVMLRVFVANALIGILLLPLILFNARNFVGLVVGVALYAALYPIVAAKIGAVGENELKMLRTAGRSLPVLNNILNAVLDYTARFV